MVDFLANYGKEIVSLLVPLVTWLLNVGLKPKARLLWGAPHSFVFLVQEPLLDAAGNQIAPNQTVRTQSIWIRNGGREKASKVELVFNWKPGCLNIWPIRPYSQAVDQDARFSIKFESFAPKEEIRLELLSVNHDLPALITVRSDESVAKEIPMRWVEAVALWKVRAIILLTFVGMGTAVYMAIVLIQLLVLKTPS